jgi:glycosyltransferase involved in cell wall biosynthesis
MHILFVSGIGGDTRRYRCDHHRQQLELHGIESTLLEAHDLQLYVAATVCDLLILHRVPWSPLLADVIDIAHGRGVPVVFETDDLVFAPEVFSRIAYLDTLPPERAQQFRADLQGQVRTFDACDCVLTTTGYLAAAAVARGKPAYVQRNACSAEMVQAAERAYALRPDRRSEPLAAQRPVVLGYFSGTGSHNRDFATIAPVLADLLAYYPHLRLHIGGHLDLAGPLLPHVDRIRRLPFVAWQELPNLLAHIHINLAPLELDNPFCQAKSEIKFTEAALVGVPTVASPTEAFAYAIDNGVDGLLAANAEEWRAALVQLIEEPQLAAELGEAARRKVYARYLPASAAPTLLATLEQIMAQHAPDPAAPQAMLQLLAKRMLDRLTRQEAENAQLQQRAEQLRHALAAVSPAGGEQGATFWRAGLQAAEDRQQAVLREILERLQRSRGATTPGFHAGNARDA